MADNFGKIFPTIYTGSMMGAGEHVFALWTYILAGKNHRGVIEVNPRLVAVLIGTTPERITLALEYLMAPDSQSRTQDQDGRRLIKRGAFEYQVVNAEKYRLLGSKEDQDAKNKEYDRNYSANRRQEKAKSTDCNTESEKTRQSEKSEHTETDSKTEGDKEEEAELLSHGTSVSLDRTDVPQRAAGGKKETPNAKLHAELPNALPPGAPPFLNMMLCMDQGYPNAEGCLSPEEAYQDPWLTVQDGWTYMVNKYNKRSSSPKKEDELRELVDDYVCGDWWWYFKLVAAILWMEYDLKARQNGGIKYLFEDEGKILNEYAAKALNNNSLTLPLDWEDGEGLSWYGFMYQGLTYKPDPSGPYWKISDPCWTREEADLAGITDFAYSQDDPGSSE